MTSTADPAFVSAAQAAHILGVSRPQILELATSAPDFPRAEQTATGGRQWRRSAIETWAVTHLNRGPRYDGPKLPPIGGFTRDTHKLIGLASDEARLLNHGVADEDHLLLAFLHPDCPGAARPVLRSFGVTLEALRQAFVASFGDPFEPREGWTQIASELQLVLERANLEAVALADLEVSSEHALLALSTDWGSSLATSLLRRHGIGAAGVRQRVADLTEQLEVPEPLQPLAIDRAPPDPAVMALELSPTPDDKDPRQREPWGSKVFVDAEGRPVKKAGWALQQYFIDRDGNPVLTTDGQPVHFLLDDQGNQVLDHNGRPLIGPVPIPSGTAVLGPSE